MNKIECENVILKISLSQKEYGKNIKLINLIDDFTTAVNDAYIDKFRIQMNFDALFADENTMIFTLDNASYVNETYKIIDKLLQNKKFKFISNRLLPLNKDEMFCM